MSWILDQQELQEEEEKSSPFLREFLSKLG